MTQLSLLAGDEAATSAAAGQFVPDTRPYCECPKCGCLSFVDKPIHQGNPRGESTRRSCAHCNHFMGFPVWYGVAEEPRTPKALPLTAELGAA